MTERPSLIRTFRDLPNNGFRPAEGSKIYAFQNIVPMSSTDFHIAD